MIWRHRNGFSVVEMVVIIAILGLLTALFTDFFSSFVDVSDNRSHAYDAVSHIDQARSGALYGSTTEGGEVRGWRGVVFAAGDADAGGGVFVPGNLGNTELEDLNKTTGETVEEIDSSILFCFISNAAISGFPTCPKDSRFISDIKEKKTTGRIGIHFRQPDTHPALVYNEGSNKKKVVLYSNIRKNKDDCSKSFIECIDKEAISVEGVQLFFGEENSESSVIIDLFGFAYVR